MTFLSYSAPRQNEMPSCCRSLGDWLARKLSRVTSSGEFIPEIDGLRFIAIMVVIFHHLMASYLLNTRRFGVVHLPDDWYRLSAESPLVHFISRGYFGVHLFFVISGFILALPFARTHLAAAPGPRLKSYYLRRLTRLEPPYVLNLVLCFLYIWMTDPGRQMFVPHFVASLFYAHGLVYGSASWINGVAWSLEVEVQFYLLVPLLATVFGIRNGPIRRTILIGSILLFGCASQWIIPNAASGRLNLSLLNFVQYFLAGLLLADLYLTGWMDKRTSYRWDLAVLLSGLMMLAIMLRFPHRAYLLPFVILLFYWSVFRGKISNTVIRLTPIVILGGICYTTYLYHNFVILFMDWAIIQFASSSRSFSLDFLLFALIQLPVIFLVCALLFVYTEKPFMKPWARIPAWKRSAVAVS